MAWEFKLNGAPRRFGWSAPPGMYVRACLTMFAALVHNVGLWLFLDVVLVRALVPTGLIICITHLSFCL